MKEISNKTNLQVLHEDNHIIVVNKRVGDIVQGDKTGDKPLSEVKRIHQRQIQQTRRVFSCGSPLRQATGL
jgi:23S rRNA pseudouridine1911/1915/1917 synthase